MLVHLNKLSTWSCRQDIQTNTECRDYSIRNSKAYQTYSACHLVNTQFHHHYQLQSSSQSTVAPCNSLHIHNVQQLYHVSQKKSA